MGVFTSKEDRKKERDKDLSILESSILEKLSKVDERFKAQFEELIKEAIERDKQIKEIQLKLNKIEFEKYVSLGGGTIEQFGAKVYQTKEEARNGESCHKAIAEMLDLTGGAILPTIGWIKLNETTILWRDDDFIIGFGNVNILCDSSESMFLPLAERQTIKGFKAHYENVTKECGVVQLGGDDRNIGALTPNLNHPDDRTKDYPFRPRRTNSISHVYDFDLIGQAHGVWVNYDEESENTHSHWHFCSIKGTYWNCDHAVKVNRRVDTQALNTFDIDLKVWGAKKFIHLDGVNFAKNISIIGQEIRETNEELFYINGHNLTVDIFIYDVARYNKNNPEWKGKITDVRRGNLHVENLTLSGYLKKKAFQVNDTWTAPSTNFNESTLTI